MWEKTAYIVQRIGDKSVHFWQEISEFVTSFIYQWSIKKCEETNFPVFASWYTGGTPTTSCSAQLYTMCKSPITAQLSLLLLHCLL